MWIRKALIGATAFGCAALLLVHAFEWSIVAWLTFFLTPMLLGAVWMGVLAVFLITAAFAILRWRRYRYAPLLPVVNLIFLLVVPRINFTPFWLALNYRLKHADRLKVAELVSSGSLPYTADWLDEAGRPYGVLHLSPGLAHTSVSGDILIQQLGDTTTVFFYTFRGLMNNFSGFVYRSNNKLPHQHAFGGYFHERIRKEPGWYWVASW